MTDDDDDRTEALRAPPPARETAPPVGDGDLAEQQRGAREGGSRRGRGRGRGRQGRKPHQRGGKPTPVREITSTPPSPSVDPDLEEVELEVGGKAWIVRVVGRSGGVSTSPAPLLMLGFRESLEPGDGPDREALVVGRLLSELSPAQLESAFEQSRAPPDPDRPRRFFADVSDRRR